MGLRSFVIAAVIWIVSVVMFVPVFAADKTDTTDLFQCAEGKDCTPPDINANLYEYLMNEEAAAKDKEKQKGVSRYEEYSTSQEEQQQKLEEEKRARLLRKLRREQISRQMAAGMGDADASGQEPVIPFDVDMLELEKQIEEELPVFGMSFFASAPMTFAPYVDAPVPDDYLLGPGDVLEVAFWNDISLASQYVVKIDSKGSARIPSVGSFPANGVTIKNFEETLMSYLSGSMGSDLEGFVRLVEVRAIQVVVAGEAAAPGHYSISGLSTAFNAIYVAGGPSEIGSMRRISHFRDNKKVGTIDFYDFLMNGAKDGDVALETGDVIHFPVIEGMIAVSGEVRRPAKYEFIKGEKLLDAVKMAGGFAAGSYLRSVRVSRVGANTGRIVHDIDMAPVIADPGHPNNLELQDGDSIEVFPVLDEVVNRVTLTGPVKRPGIYELKHGMTVKDLIETAQGFDGEAYMGRGDIFRTNDDETVTLISVDLAAALEGDKEQNQRLEPKDELVVYTPDEAIYVDRTVSVFGQVVNPGVYKKTKGMTAADLVNMAGGLMPQAADEMEVGRVVDSKTGRVEITTLETEAVMGGVKRFALEDGDVLSVKKIQDGEMKPSVVTVEGEVKYPGKFTITPGERLSSLVARVGGVTKDAFTPGAIFVRTDMAKINIEQTNVMEEITTSFREYVKMVNRAKYSGLAGQDQQSVESEIPMGAIISGSVAEAVSRSRLLQDETEMRQTSDGELVETEETKPIPRRIVINYEKAIANKGGMEDLVLRDGDVLIIPERPSTIIVSGAVVNPSSFPFAEKEKVEAFINRAGRYTEDAEPSRIVVVRANGEVLHYKDVKYVEEGDIILVPWKPIDTETDESSMQRIQRIVSITTSLLTGVYMVDRLDDN